MVGMSPGVAGASAETSSLNSFSALIDLLADPAATKARIKELTDKVNAANKALADAKAVNVKAEATRKEAEQKLAEANAINDGVAAKAADLLTREGKLAQQLVAHENNKVALAVEKANHVAHAKSLAVAARELKAAQDAHQLAVDKSRDDIQRIAAESTARVEAASRAKLDNANRAEQEALKKLEAADAALADAEAKRNALSEQVAALHKVIQGD